jgi:hypothetical protein
MVSRIFPFCHSIALVGHHLPLNFPALIDGVRAAAQRRGRTGDVGQAFA